MTSQNSDKPQRPLIECHWMIKHTFGGVGFYYGTFRTRKEAINEHERQTGKPWKYWYRKGDRVVRVTVTDNFLGALNYYRPVGGDQ